MNLKYLWTALAALIFLNGCNQDESSTPSAVVEPTKTDVELLNEQEWDDNRVYVTKDNYILMKEANGTIPGLMKPCFVVNSAKEWPREDLSNADSYDLPRVDFRWNNGDFVSASASEKAIYESYDKVWSIKTDGTDLRLVTDDFSGDVRIMRRSPNNRYLAYSYASRTSGGTDKVVFDVQTQKSTLLGTDLGHSQFLWAEDSSYLYFEDRAKYWKYEITTGKITQMDDDFYFSEVGVIYGGKRYVVSEFGVGVYDEKSDKRLYGVSIYPKELQEKKKKQGYLVITREHSLQYELKSRSISPDGKYAWGESAQYRYFINTETKEVKLEKKDPKKKSQYRFFDVLGLNAEYVRSASAGSARQYKLTIDKKLFSQTQHWGQICSGHSATLSWLYNGFANNGAFIKEDK
ncbi:hypothetical protein [Aliivibrio fischeri]|uniref:hypothetical protein n=1 Tax=Aliivibrio fischeri TaxID=668 RepID=UPI001F47703D|nr:hypothetical protein [Aliivibrio fischeri]MCE7555215.1 hypothetical protein [Aliivibrio fischeri]MCE7562483.1 hypothetical protein [Aliivibrio fischeri]MCE7569891.1 hypothetical protein [Aliivibrio fischeri]